MALRSDPNDLRARAKMLQDMAALFSDPSTAERTRTLAERYIREAEAIEGAQDSSKKLYQQRR